MERPGKDGKSKAKIVKGKGGPAVSKCTDAMTEDERGYRTHVALHLMSGMCAKFTAPVDDIDWDKTAPIAFKAADAFIAASKQ